MERITATTTRALTRSCAAVASSSASAAASTRRSAWRSPSAPSARRASWPCSCPRPTPTPTQDRGQRLCEVLGVEAVLEDIAPALAALGCYRRRDEAIRRVFPDFGDGWRQKITLAEGLLDTDRVSYFNLTVADPDGRLTTERMPTDVYLEVVAATNMKQRTRKLIEYTHADARNFAVLGTPNRLEYELGFFVRGGDGLADVKPISHLYKTQVYALAATWACPRTSAARRPAPTRTASRRPRRSSTSPCPTRRWTCCCGPGTTT